MQGVSKMKPTRFCVSCGGLVERIWCKSCRKSTKTLDLLWDFEDDSLIIMSNYTKTDHKDTYSLHEKNNHSQKLTEFQRDWI